MKARQVGWVILAAILVTGLATVALAGEEHEKEKEHRVVIFGGHARLGVHVSNITPEKAEELNLSEDKGVLIEEVEEESAAAKAGLQANDVLFSFDGVRLRSVRQLRRLVQETPAGREVEIEFSREGQRRTARAELEERHARFHMPEIHMPEMEGPHVEIPDLNIWAMGRGPRLGISGDELTPQLAEFFGVEEGKGVLVREVAAGSAAARAGVQAGDVIVSVDDQQTPSVGELRRALRRAEEDQVTLTIVRGRRQQTLPVTLDRPQRRSPRRISGVTIEIDPEDLQEWKTELNRWKQEFRTAGREWKKAWREAEREWRDALKSEEFRRELRELQDELRWRLGREAQTARTI
jgi:membrane-associated protease RseP (regulator of RpoE activity)